MKAIYPVSPDCARDNDALRRKVGLAESIATLLEAGQLTPENIQNLIDTFGCQVIGKFAHSLPGTNVFLESYKKLKKKEVFHKEQLEFTIKSEEFNKAIELWTEYFKLRAAQKEKFGHAYGPMTPQRYIRDGKSFCHYLESIGVTNWVDVAQRHLNGYLDIKGRNRAQRVYRFMQFVKKNFRVVSTFAKPVGNKPQVINRVVHTDQFDNVLNLALESSDIETSLAVYFVGLYAQTIKTLSEMKIDQIRETSSGFEVRFFEGFIPLDSETAGLVRKYLSHRNDLQAKELVQNPDLLFISNCPLLGARAKRVSKVRMKNLRLTAIMNMLKNGFTDRQGIKRTLGVSMETVAIVERACGYDIQDSISEEAAQLRSDLLNGKLNGR
ncbi:MAG: hypothetical protein IPI97_14455 [Nitrosomonas sp.]|nr:hypothetical protein [Nitrosomonas sp.]